MRNARISLLVAFGCVSAELFTPYPRSAVIGYIMFFLWIIGAVALSNVLVAVFGYTKKGYNASWGILAGCSVCLAGLFMLLEASPIVHPLFMLTMFLFWSACLFGVRYFFMAMKNGENNAT